MVMFIGDNDKSTLIGVIEEIDRLIKREEGIERRATTVRSRERAVYAMATLRDLRGVLDMAKDNGPLARFESALEHRAAGRAQGTAGLERLLEDEAQRLSGQLGDIDYDVPEVEDGKGPTMYAYAVGGVRSPKNYLERSTALTALVDRMSTMLTESVDGAYSITAPGRVLLYLTIGERGAMVTRDGHDTQITREEGVALLTESRTKGYAVQSL